MITFLSHREAIILKYLGHFPKEEKAKFMNGHS